MDSQDFPPREGPYPTVFWSAAETFHVTIQDSSPNDPHFGKFYHKIQQVQDTTNDDGGPQTIY